MLLTNTLLVITVIGIATLSWLFLRSKQTGDPHLSAELERRREEIGELKNQCIQLKSEKDELSGNNKVLFAEKSDIKAQLKELSTRVATFEAEEKRKDREHQTSLEKLEAAQKSLERERERVTRADAARQEQEMEERDRLWAEHEHTVVAHLTELCRKPQYGFTCYDNANLPEGFYGSLKPDVLIEFIGQYVIFDAKVSKASNMQTYIADQVKKTATKVKGKKDIYPTVFLVIPTHAVGELKKLSYYEDGFSFFVVSPEALEPILATLKRIANYEFAQEMDPQQRENLVDILAHLDFHISTRNAVDWHLMQHGIATLAKIRETDPELLTEVLVKREKIRNINFNTSDVKELVANPERVQERLLELTQPHPQLSKKDLDALRK
ncbi:hypothetical protein COU80_02315 [Candidatus Peregrinibacteria bacterium CG10_big_fil_rev_8_21_14_0_10_55_24]|nr:MAG: hypothetical protein COU80_02315 [Candidatus Peregrinibacteria bacterium CG10_big_fil_rev_8_21_14_0_10_55_24]